MSDMPTVRYWHLWTDSDGISRQTQCTMEHFDLKAIQPSIDAQWQGEKTSSMMSTMITVLPIGWVGAWHENPRPQWIIPLSGRWFVEAMDGTRVEFGAGQLSFGGDQGCRDANGKKGHKSGTVGDTPAVLMIVQFDTMSASKSPCVFQDSQ